MNTIGFKGLPTPPQQSKVKRPNMSPKPATTDATVQQPPKRTGKVILPVLSALALVGAAGIGANTAIQRSAPVEKAGAVANAAPAVKNDGVLVVTSASIDKDPDRMQFNASIREENADYNTVMSNLDKRGTALAKALKELNLNMETTSGVSVQPNYKYDEKTSERQLAGYQGVYSICVKGDIKSEKQFKEDASKITKAISENGGFFSGPFFSLKNRDAAQTEALQKAVADAVSKADTVAKKMGFDVNQKRPYSVTIGDAPNYNQNMYGESSVRSFAAAAPAGRGISAEAFEMKKIQVTSPSVTIKFNMD